MNNLLVAQSGGPTSVINASLEGVVSQALLSGNVNKIYGGIHGIKGIMDGNIKEIGTALTNPQELSLLAHTPAAALGSCRFKLDSKPETYDKILEILREYEIGYFIYIGGNDSMDTAYKLSEYFSANGAGDIKVMGCPKTIDNDLCVTDHTPGFGSAAKFIAVATAEIFCDANVYYTPQVIVLEAMGRNTGWLAAASSLSGLNGGMRPQFIYLPEVAFDDDRFLSDVSKELKNAQPVVITVSEGIKDASGKYVCEKDESKNTDSFGHKFLSGSGKYVERLVSTNLGCKTRTIELSLLQRCAGHITSFTDLEEARMLGSAAMSRALDGVSGEMPYVERLSDSPYKIRIGSTSIKNIANLEKKVPLEWLNEEKNNVNQKMIDYLSPLIQGECPIRYKNGIPEHIKLY